MDPEVLGRVTAGLPRQDDPRLLVGFEHSDDAGVVRLPDGRCLVQTVDFFTPIVDDPWAYGAIAAVNALSDVYAMGGRALSALNILCWDTDLPEEVLHAILRGGAETCQRAGVLLVGGHSVTAPELKFGMAVTGEVDEDRIWTNGGARPGDVLVLTKPLGTGVISTAIKRDGCSDEAYDAALESMLRLNRDASLLGQQRDVHACTDITGFGVAGHGFEMARASGVRVVLDMGAMPYLPHALQLSAAGFNPGGAKKNRRMIGDALDAGDVQGAHLNMAFDPQTSGGLLLALPADQAEGLGPVVGRIEEGPVALVLRSSAPPVLGDKGPMQPAVDLKLG